MSIPEKLANSIIVQIILTLIVYAFYGGVLGLCLIPSVYFIAKGYNFFSLNSFTNILTFSLIVGLNIYLFFLTGIIVMSVFIRLLSLGIKPGKYNAFSFTTLRWLIYSGIYNMATKIILPIVSITFFSTIFFKIIGCKIGKNVRLNTWILNDSYLLEIEDNVVIGGATDISCHLFENNKLILNSIKIGSGTLIGAHCYVSPGVTIGKNCTIGMYTFIRKDKTIPDNTVITPVSGMNIRDTYLIEKKMVKLLKLWKNNS